MLKQNIRKMGTSKNTVKPGYFDGRRPILGLCWPILGLCWPILGLYWPILRPILVHLEAMLAHIDPSGATKAEKCELDDGWPESEKDVFQAALSMVVVKNSR